MKVLNITYKFNETNVLSLEDRLKILGTEILKHNSNDDDIYGRKYLKYKKKYLELKYNQNGGGNSTYIDILIKNKDGNVEDKRFTIDKKEDIETFVKSYFGMITKLVCLDFHGVTDLFDSNEKIPLDLPKCVISFIGGKKETVESTRASLIPRIKSGEIMAGIIVYTKDSMPVCGTKGWIISIIKKETSIKTIHFIDDSRKNIECVNNLEDPNIKTYYINKRRNPKQYLIKLLQRGLF